MSEDDSRHETADSAERSADKPRRSWLDRISAALSGEPTSREDLVELLRDVQADGLIAADTLRMMEGAIAVSDMSVGDVMVPRAQMVALPADARFLDLMKEVVESGHSRFPVHGEDKDEILGILLAKDLLRGVVADNGPGTIRELLRPAVLIPESKKLNVLLREFRQSRNHMAIVIDEYGGVAGLVTIEDVLEQIVGDIDDEHDEAEDGSPPSRRPGSCPRAPAPSSAGRRQSRPALRRPQRRPPPRRTRWGTARRLPPRRTPSGMPPPPSRPPCPAAGHRAGDEDQTPGGTSRSPPPNAARTSPPPRFAPAGC